MIFTFNETEIPPDTRNKYILNDGTCSYKIIDAQHHIGQRSGKKMIKVILLAKDSFGNTSRVYDYLIPGHKKFTDFFSLHHLGQVLLSKEVNLDSLIGLEGFFVNKKMPYQGGEKNEVHYYTKPDFPPKDCNYTQQQIEELGNESLSMRNDDPFEDDSHIPF